MGFALGSKDNTYRLIKYDYSNSADHKLFLAGSRIGTLSAPLVYSVVRPSSMPKIQRNHLIESVGPVLASDQLRAVIERIAPDDVEFFPVELRDGPTLVSGFSAMNVINMRPCIDMEQSEYQQTNFDPAKPIYNFTFYRIDSDQPYGCRIALAQHLPRLVVVDETVKAACFSAKLKGLNFASAIDLTPSRRGIVERI